MDSFWTGFEKAAAYTAVVPLKTDVAKNEYTSQTMKGHHRGGALVGGLTGALLAGGRGHGLAGTAAGAALGAGIGGVAGHMTGQSHAARASRLGLGTTRHSSLLGAMESGKKYTALSGGAAPAAAEGEKKTAEAAADDDQPAFTDKELKHKARGLGAIGAGIGAAAGAGGVGLAGGKGKHMLAGGALGGLAEGLVTYGLARHAQKKHPVLKGHLKDPDYEPAAKTAGKDPRVVSGGAEMLQKVIEKAKGHDPRVVRGGSDMLQKMIEKAKKRRS